MSPSCNNIILPLHKQFPCFLACMLGLQPDKIIILHYLCTDKSPFKVAVDDPCGLRGCHTPGDGPGPAPPWVRQ